MSIEHIDNLKRTFIASIIHILEDEICNEQFTEQQKESIEVAVQCLQSTYGINYADKIANQTAIHYGSLKTLLKENGKETEAENLKEKGNEAMRKAEYTRAIEYYTNAIQLNSTNAKYYCNRAAAYDKIAKYEEAISDCKEAINLDPLYSKAFARMGNTYVNLGRYKEAKDSYIHALKYDQNNTDYKANLNLCEEHMKNAGIANNFSDLLNNPNILNLASQLLSNPNGIRDLVSTMMSNEGCGSDPNIENLAQMLRDGMQMNDATASELVAALNNNTDNSDGSSPKRE